MRAAADAVYVMFADFHDVAMPRRWRRYARDAAI